MSNQDFDDILTTLGLGRWNLLYYIGMGFYWAALPGFMLSGGFISPRVEYQCEISDENVKNVSTDQCSYTVVNNFSAEYNVEEDVKCSDWTYDTTDFDETLTSEFHLVCDKAYLRPVYQTVYMAGDFIGAPMNGFLADRFGRKRIITIISLISVISILLSTVVTNFTAILMSRLLTGLTSTAIFQIGFMLCMEVSEPKRRSTFGIILSLPWAFGTMWWGALGYWIRDWRWLMRAATVPTVFFFICLWHMDESPRWLFVRGRHEQAVKHLKKAAKWNNASLPSDAEILKGMEQSSCNQSNQPGSKEKMKKSSNIQQIKRVFRRIMILYKTPETRKRVLLLHVMFLISGTVYYGLTLNAVNFQLNPYMYMIVGGLMEVPAYIIPAPVVAKFGRIKPTSISYFICGLIILAMAFLPTDPKWLVMTFAMMGKFFICTGFQILFLITSEVLPTEIRMQGLGTSSFLTSVGAFAAPFVTDLLGDLYSWIPSIIFGGASILAGIASIFIPETLNKHLPETIQQLETEVKSKHRQNEDEVETLKTELN